MNKEMILVALAVSNEKGLDKELVFEALEEALAIATQKQLDVEDAVISVVIDRKTGDILTTRSFEVVPSDNELFNDDRQMTLEQAQAHQASIQPGEILCLPMENMDLGRIGAQAAKQIVMQKLRSAKREQLAHEYESQIGKLISGTVKKVTRELVILELPNGADGLLPRREMIPKEVFRLNERVRAVIKQVDWDNKGPTILLSRADNAMLAELFSIEVPEIGQGSIEIRAVARDPGSRAKVAVQAKDGRIEPKGACIGMRGSRVNSVMEEVGGERIDIILWDENDARFVVNALSPAEVKSMMIDEEQGLIQVVVDPDCLSQAIGRNGQNVRLASELTGWNITVVTAQEAERIQEEESQTLKNLFVDEIELEEPLAEALVEAGFTDAHELAYVEQADYHALGLDDELITYIREKAQAYLLRKVEQPTIGTIESMKGMNKEWIDTLKDNNITTIDDLAELSIPDLLDLIGDCSQEQAAQFIMEARASWFDDKA